MEVTFYDASHQSFSDLRDSIHEKKCPRCHSKNSPLNAFLIITVKSFLLFTFNKKEIVIGCPKCIISTARKANIKSLLYGWWGFPLGPLSTIFALMHNWIVFEPSYFNDKHEELIDYILEKGEN